MISPAVSVRDVSKAYGPRTVLNRVNLQVAPGEIYGIFGSNGCGKSTLLRILAGSIRPDGGTAAGTGLAGYVAQRFSLYRDLSVEENLTFYARCYRRPIDSIRSGIEKAIERLELGPYRRQRAGRLSHGWKQRLSLAAALCHEPSVLLLDEATAGIDPIARTGLWRILADCTRSGTAIVLATHFTDEAERCDRTGYLEQGALAALAPGALAGGSRLCRDDTGMIQR